MKNLSNFNRFSIFPGKFLSAIKASFAASQRNINLVVCLWELRSFFFYNAGAKLLCLSNKKKL
jgi:hypothetical protein